MPLYAVTGDVPIGGIILWSGTIASIPVNWHLCDGTSGTPDLRDKFVVGAKQDNAGVPNTNVEGSLTATGGHTQHAHTASGAALSAHALTTSVAVSTHTLSTSVAIDAHAGTAVSAHTLSTNVAVTASHATQTSFASGTTRVGDATTAVSVGVTQPVVAAHSVTQPNAHAITQPVVGDHAITQPVVGAHAITQPTIASSTVGDQLPPYMALGYIQRLA